MCGFCEEIYSLDEPLPDKNCISYDKIMKQFDIWAATADPYDSGVIEDVRYCPYCGRELKGETK